MCLFPKLITPPNLLQNIFLADISNLLYKTKSNLVRKTKSNIEIFQIYSLKSVMIVLESWKYTKLEKKY